MLSQYVTATCFSVKPNFYFVSMFHSMFIDSLSLTMDPEAAFHKKILSKEVKDGINNKLNGRARKRKVVQQRREGQLRRGHIRVENSTIKPKEARNCGRCLKPYTKRNVLVNSKNFQSK